MRSTLSPKSGKTNSESLNYRGIHLRLPACLTPVRVYFHRMKIQGSLSGQGIPCGEKNMSGSEQTISCYIAAVDEVMEAYYGVRSDQDELEFIAAAHADNLSAEVTAFRLIAQRP